MGATRRKRIWIGAAKLGRRLGARIWHDYRARQVRRFLLAWLLLSVIIAGSIADAWQFASGLAASAIGWIVLAVFGLLVAVFLLIARRELSPFASGGIPVLEELTGSPRLRFGPLTSPQHLDDISRIADAVFRENAMSRELIGELHWHSRDSVFVLEDSVSGVVGYASIMSPTPAITDLLLAGRTDPLKWSAKDFLAGPGRWRHGYLYLESIAVFPKEPTYTLILYRHLARYFEELLASDQIPRNGELRLLGLSASGEGVSLLSKTLGLKLSMAKENREDEMDLYEGTMNLEKLSVIRARLDAVIEGYLQRRVTLPWE